MKASPARSSTGYCEAGVSAGASVVAWPFSLAAVSSFPFFFALSLSFAFSSDY